MASSRHHDDTTLSDSRPPAMWSMLAASLASSPGWWKVGRTATISSSLSVTAARAAAVDQASSAGASGPLMSLSSSSAISVRSNPMRSLLTASARTSSHVADIPSSSTLRSQPPKTGIQ